MVWYLRRSNFKGSSRVAYKEPLTVSAAPVTSLKGHIIHKYPNPLQVTVHTPPATPGATTASAAPISTSLRLYLVIYKEL
jgi:hypothetical protein